MLKKPRQSQVVPLALMLLMSSLLLPGVSVHAEDCSQQSAVTVTTEHGIELYKQGDTKGAIKALQATVKEDKDNADAWYYLSLALNRNNDFKGARKAIEKTVKLRPDFAAAHAGLAYFLLLSNKLRDALREAERAITLDVQNAEAHLVIGTVWLRQNDPEKALEEAETALNYSPDLLAALLLKSQSILNVYAQRTEGNLSESIKARLQLTKGHSELFRQAAESLEKYLQLESSPRNADIWRKQLATLRIYAESVKQDGSNIEAATFAPSEVTTKARILYREEPQYTTKARDAQVTGTVVMYAILAADGTVRNILVLRSLPYGLTEETVKAAHKIKFVPAAKDGRPVSQFIQIEYNFNLY